MKTVLTTLAALTTAASIASEEPAGYAPFSVDAPHHDRGMIGAIWYPSMGDGRAFAFADSAVFHGVTVGLQHWTRVQDLSLALDTLLDDPKFATYVDQDRIMAAGFSYAGWTALSIGGVLGDHAGYLDHCDTFEKQSSHCVGLAQADVSVADIGEASWNASYADPRVTHVTAIDPGLIWGLDASATADVIDNIHLIGLGQGTDRLFAVDFEQSGFGALLPTAQIDTIASAMHFTALPLCKPMAEAILLEEQDDPVCTDPSGTDRAAVHDMITRYILSDLGL